MALTAKTPSTVAGDDVIDGNAGADELSGDKGDDSITSSSDEASMASGGEGDDTITLTSAVDIADEKAHTVVGGAVMTKSLLRALKRVKLTVAAKIRITPLLTTPQFSSTPLENSSKAMILLTKSP